MSAAPLAVSPLLAVRAGSAIPPLAIRSPVTGRGVAFPRAALLAPMEGITDRRYRGLVLALGDAGGACTEFVRLSSGPVGEAALRRELGTPHPRIPTGLQIMAPGPEFVAETAAAAARAGAPWVDLNFGCPVRRVFHKCAGSALLADPARLGSIVRAAAGAAGVPVSAKVRAGIEDASRLDEVLDAAAEGGAAMITLHARLRLDSYATAARWEWIARAAERVHARHPGVALVGNGGVERASDVARMLRETGCDGVMVGRAAFADPWIFREAAGGPPSTAGEAREFALRYFDLLLPPGGPAGALGAFKQLVRYYRAGGLFDGREGDRVALLRCPEAATVRRWFEEA